MGGGGGGWEVVQGGWQNGGDCDNGGDYQGALVVSNPVEGKREDTLLLRKIVISVKIEFCHRNTDILSFIMIPII